MMSPGRGVTLVIAKKDSDIFTSALAEASANFMGRAVQRSVHEDASEGVIGNIPTVSFVKPLTKRTDATHLSRSGVERRNARIL